MRTTHRIRDPSTTLVPTRGENEMHPFRKRYIQVWSAAITFGTLGLWGCGDEPTAPPAVGSVLVVTSTSGQSVDADGFTVTVAGGPDIPIDVDDTETVEDVETGTRSVELTGLTPNCTVVGDNPRDVTVAEGATATVVFDIECLLVAFDRLSITSDRSGNSEIYLVDPDGSNPTNVTNNPGLDAGGAISPDGTRIAFTSDRDGNYDVFVAFADGSGVVNISDSPADDVFPAWSPDGTQLVFASDRSGDFQIWTIDADGSNPLNISDSPGSDQQLNDWSPDGSRIAFVTDRDGNSEIYVMNADGSGVVNLTQDPGSDMYPSWSPDGSKIAFSSDRDGNSEIYVMDADGGNPMNLTQDPAEDTFATWSPDGSLIVFTSDRDGDRDVYVMTAAGAGAQNITNNMDDDLNGPIQGWR